MIKGDDWVVHSVHGWCSKQRRNWIMFLITSDSRAAHRMFNQSAALSSNQLCNRWEHVVSSWSPSGVLESFWNSSLARTPIYAVRNV